VWSRPLSGLQTPQVLFSPAFVAWAGVPSRRDPERLSLPHEVKGQQTGPGMEPQGQQGRRPSAHAPCAIRRFERDAVVFE
jgi:hypothetical protein